MPDSQVPEKAIVTIRGTIPVYVEVDVESREVVRVIASDEEFVYDSDVDEKAKEIAENVDFWPGWDWGY